MAKPIVVAYYPFNHFFRSGVFDFSILHKTYYEMSTHLPDYIVLICPDPNPDLTRMELKVFYEKDFTEIQHAELLQLINDKLNDTNTPG